MPLDPTIQPIVDLVNEGAKKAPPLAEQTVEERREAYRKLLAAVPPGPDIDAVVDRDIDGPAGALRLRIYRPADPIGIVAFFHGGGWTIGDLDTHDEPCRQIARQAQVTVVSVDYRLAPESPFPAALDDGFAALAWIDANRSELCRDDAGLAVCGDSAGANIAAALCLQARDQGGPTIDGQLLVYPSVDARMVDHDSLTRNAEGYILTRETMEWFRGNYLTTTDERLDWRASPLLADDLSGLPPALVITAEFDPLHDEGVAYAAALREAGVPVEHIDYDGMVHIFFQLGPLVPAGAAAVTEVAMAARKALTADPPWLEGSSGATS